MKTLIKLALLGCFTILLTMDACEFLTGNKCDDTTIDFDEPIIYLRLHITDALSPDNDHLTTDADKAVFVGKIQKIYCGGDYSDGFAFDHTLYLSKDYTKEYLNEGIFLDQPYQFKFTNSEDILAVLTTIKLYFKDGKIFNSAAGGDNYKHEDIKYDYNRMDKYIDLYLPEPRGWYQGQSK